MIIIHILIQMTDRKRQLTTEEKDRIINLYTRKYTVDSIADIYQVAESTIYRLIKKYKKTNSTERTKGSGVKSDQNKTDKIIKIVNMDNNLSTNDISKLLLEEYNIECSKSTVHRHLKNNNYINRTPILKPLLTEEHKNCRENWAIFYQYYNWDNVIWSDECNINAQSNKKSKIWINKTDDVPIRRVVKYPISIHVWGCLLKSNKLIIEIYEKTMDSNKYIEILKIHLLKLMDINKDVKLLYQQDNAPCHTSFSTISFFSENKIEVMYWPPNSPDLNPIENIWNILKRNIGNVIIKNKQELINIVRNEASKISIEIINNLINSMDNRIEELFNKSFDSISY